MSYIDLSVLVGLTLASLSIGYYYISSYYKLKNVKSFITDKNHIPSIIINNIKVFKELKETEEFEENTSVDLDLLKIYYSAKLAHLLLYNIDFSDNKTYLILDKLFKEYNVIYIDYTLNNDSYKIIVNGHLEPIEPLTKNKKNTHILQRKVISAELVSDIDEINVTSLICAYQGPHNNFYNNLKNNSNKIKDFLRFLDYKDLSYEYLIISDIFGQEHKFHINENISWTSTFTEIKSF